jgi:hypothetical protein
MSAKINAATVAMVLAILALPSVVSAQQGYVRHGLLNLTEATGNQSQPQMNRLKAKAASNAYGPRYTGSLNPPTDAFGATMAPSGQYGGGGATGAATTVTDPHGKIIGADPDARIRFELRRDYGRGF